MMQGFELKRRFKEDSPLFGTLIVSPSPAWPEAVRDCGLDFIFIDTEHIALDRERLSWMCRTYQAMGLPPLVRIQDQDPCAATAILDDGATGVVIPYVEKAATVRQMVGASKMRPLKGHRLETALDGKPLESGLCSYVSKRTENNILVVNIESRPAMDSLDTILAEKDLDAVLIGPHDLSSSLGIPEDYGNPEFMKACETILGKARRAGKGAGIHHWLAPEQQVSFVEMGANIMIHSADIILFRQGMQRDLQAIRSALGLRGSSAGASPLNI